MAGVTPLIDYNGGGSIVEWTETVDAMMEEFDFDTVNPGHGGVTDPEGLRTYRDNVVELRDRVSALIRDGRSQEEIGEIIGMEYPSYSPGSLFMEWSLPGSPCRRPDRRSRPWAWGRSCPPSDG